jgi:hypothetical protein
MKKLAMLVASLAVVSCRPQKLETSDPLQAGESVAQSPGGDKGDLNALVRGLSSKRDEELRNLDTASSFLMSVNDAELLMELNAVRTAARENVGLLAELITDCSKDLGSCPQQKQNRWKRYLPYDTSALYDAAVATNKMDKMDDHFTAWAKFEPNNLSPKWRLDEDCAVVEEAGLWRDVTCDQELAFACKTSEGEWLLEAKGSWNEHKKACAGGKFVRPGSAAENEELVAALKSAGLNSAWINYSDINLEGFWISAK